MHRYTLDYVSADVQISDDGRFAIQTKPLSMGIHKEHIIGHKTTADGYWNVAGGRLWFLPRIILSADGLVVSGESGPSNVLLVHAFRWTKDGGMQDLGTLCDADADCVTWLNGMSSDGSVLIGDAFLAEFEEGVHEGYPDGPPFPRPSDNLPDRNAFRWTEEGGTQDIGTLRADNSGNAYAYDITADGSILIGRADDDNDGVDFPVSYDEHTQKSTYATLGMTAEFAVSDHGTLQLSGRMEFDLDRSQNPVTGTSDIPGMESFSVDSPALQHSNRGFALVKYIHTLSNGAAMDLSLKLQQSAYSAKPTALASLGYQIQF